MKAICAKEAAAFLGARIIGCEDAVFTGVVRDNRDVREGDLFTAIIGASQDGHRYLADAMQRGAAAALVQEGNPYVSELAPAPGKALLCVPDTTEALQKLGGFLRDRFDIPFVGVTGSVGKTSTKDLIAAALSGRFRVIKTQGNYNNQIGVPLTLLSLEEDTEAAVVEMGMDHAGQIEYISRFVKPDMAVITNIGISHIENFENREGILKAKLEIMSHMNPDGTLFLNGDDPRLKQLRGKLPVRTEYFGLGEDNDARLLECTMADSGFVRVRMEYRGEEYRYVLATMGSHMAQNSLPAVMIACHLGLTKSEIISGLTQYLPTEKRLQMKENGRVHVIDDSYNASPDSMRAAIRVLEQISFGGRRIALLGDMFELGAQEESGHRLVGQLAAECGTLDEAWFVGSRMKLAYEEACKRSPKARLLHFEDVDELKKALPGLLREDDVVLVKASHGMRFDAVCNFILDL